MISIETDADSFLQNCTGQKILQGYNNLNEQPKNIKMLARYVYKVNRYLDIKSKHYRKGFAQEFFDNGGCDALLKVMEHPHKTLNNEAKKAFLNLICDFNVVSKFFCTPSEHKVDLYISLIGSTIYQPIAGMDNFCKRAVTILAILVSSAPKGFEMFHKAMIQLSESKMSKPYEHLAHWLDSNHYNEEMRKPVLNLLDIVLQHSFMVKDQTELLIQLWRDSKIYAILETLTKDQIAKQILEAFGDALSQMRWRSRALQCRRDDCTFNVGSKIDLRQDTPINRDQIVELIESRVPSIIKEEFESSDQRLREINRKLEDTVSQLKNNTTNIKDIEKKLEDCFDYSAMVQQSKEKKTISNCQVMANFYRTVQSKLNIILLALNVVKSGLLAEADPLTTGGQIADKSIQLAGELIPLPGVQAAATIVRQTMAFVRAQKRKNQRKNMSQIGVGITQIERITEVVARRLTIGYKEQLNRITKMSEWRKHSTLIAECFAHRLLEGIRVGVIPDVKDTGSSEDTIIQGLLDSVVAGDPEINSSLKKSGSPFCKFATKKYIITNDQTKWDTRSFIVKPGIVATDGCKFSGRFTDPGTYGYRVGTRDEAHSLGLQMTSGTAVSKPDFGVEFKTLDPIVPFKKHKFQPSIYEEIQLLKKETERHNNVISNQDRQINKLKEFIMQLSENFKVLKANCDSKHIKC
jgi:hypothetical protein